MFDESLEALPGQVDAVKLRVATFELGDDAQRLRIVVEAAVGLQALVKGILAGMAEGRVAEIMDERDTFSEILIELQRPCQGTGNLRHLDRVGETCAVVVAVHTDENLRLVFQPPEGRGVDDAVTVALEFRPGERGAFRNQRPRVVQGSAA